MGFKFIVKKGLGSGLNPKRWLGFDRLKSDTKLISSIFKSTFKRSTDGAKQESFEQAMKRYKLTEKDINKRIKTAKDLIVVFLTFTCLLLVYMTYQWINSYIFNGFICLILASLTLAYAFREHFNLFQMRQRRLGCSYAEWFKATFRGWK